MGIGGQAYPPFGAGEPYKKALNKDNQSFLDAWASRSAIWGTRHGLGESLDRYLGLHHPTMSSDLTNQLADLGLDDLAGKSESPLSYGNILKLNDGYVAWKDLSWNAFSDKARQNTQLFRQAIKENRSRSFFAEISPKAYAKEILWESNVKPFKELFSGSKQNLFMNLGYTVGVGLSGASVLKASVQHYRYWKQQENGSLSSRVKNLYETAKATGQKAIQAIASWEAASIGMAVGRALLPIGAIPIGGILVGALLATTAYTAIGKLFPSLSKLDFSEN